MPTTQRTNDLHRIILAHTNDSALEFHFVLKVNRRIVPSYQGILNFNQVIYTLSDNLQGIALG